MPNLVENQPFIFFAGIIRIVIGLAVLVGNGPWGSTAIQIVVAVIGWISLVRGIVLLLVTTEQQRRLIEFWRKDTTFVWDATDDISAADAVRQVSIAAARSVRCVWAGVAMTLCSTPSMPLMMSSSGRVPTSGSCF